MKKLIIIGLILLLPSWAFGATYYMRSDGTAANKAAASGPCGTQANCMSIATHDADTYSAGDTIILCDDGGTYRDQMDIPSSGSDGSPITYEAASGDTPIISGADIVSTWIDADEEHGEIFSSGLEQEVDAFTTDFTSKTVDTGSSVLITQTVANSGSDAAAITMDGGDTHAYSYKSFDGQTEVYYRCYFRVDAAYDAADDGNMYILWLDDGGSYVSYLLLKDHADGLSLEFKSRVAGTIYAGNPGDISVDTWYRLEGRFLNHASTGGAEFWLDGVSKGSDYTDNTQAYTPDGLKVGIVGKSAGTQPDANSILYFDDVVVSTSAIGAYGGTTNVYSATLAGATEAKFVMFDTTIGSPDTSIANLATDQEFYHETATDLLFQNSSSDPDTRYTSPGTQAGQRNFSIYATGKDYITIDGLKFQGGNLAAGGYGQLHIDDGDYWVATNNTFEKTTSSGIRLASASTYATIGTSGNGNTFQNTTMDGMKIGDTDDLTTGNHNVSYNTFQNLLFDGNGAILNYQDSNTFAYNVFTGTLGTDGGSADHCIYNSAVGGSGASSNIFEYNKAHTLTIPTGFSFFTNQGASNIVRYNWIDGTDYGVYLARDSGGLGDNNELYCNVFINIADKAVEIDGGDGSKIYNNTFECDRGLQINVGGDGNSSGTLFKNNIIYGATGKIIEVNAGQDTSVDIDYNQYPVTGGTLYEWTGTDYNFANWKTNSSQDANSPTPADPLFTNAGGDDFTLKPGSPCRHGATYLSGYEDKLRPESTWPDGVVTMEDILSIGAYGIYRGAAGM